MANAMSGHKWADEGAVRHSIHKLTFLIRGRGVLFSGQIETRFYLGRYWGCFGEAELFDDLVNKCMLR